MWTSIINLINTVLSRKGRKEKLSRSGNNIVLTKEKGDKTTTHELEIKFEDEKDTSDSHSF